jgi:hypothetical protein
MEVGLWVRWSRRNPEMPLTQYSSDVRFNDRWHTFTPSAAKGGQVAPMQSEGM